MGDNPWCLGFSPDSIMSSLDLIRSLLLVHLIPFDFLCLAWGPDMDTGGDQSTTDALSGGIESFRDCVLACSRFIHGNDFIGREIDFIRGGTVPRNIRFHAPLSQAAGDSIGIVPHPDTNIDERHAFAKKTFRVTEHVIREFSDYVYNLQTVSGSYVASTIQVGNCSAEPVIEGAPPPRENRTEVIREVRRKREALRKKLKGRKSARLIAR